MHNEADKSNGVLPHDRTGLDHLSTTLRNRAPFYLIELGDRFPGRRKLEYFLDRCSFFDAEAPKAEIQIRALHLLIDGPVDSHGAAPAVVIFCGKRFRCSYVARKNGNC